MQRKIITLLILSALFFAHGSVLALSSTHIPVGEDQAAWRAAVCESMTAGGCAYFSAHEAEPAWLALKAMDATGAETTSTHKVADISDDIELRQIELLVFTSSGERQAHTVYATVETETQLLDRVVVFDQTLLAKEQ
jgi:hypothetical protein